ncbi:hypothetical protein QFC19_001143 [Naganishia cerealis]|uniref:Uncharacterized protein n=1 Tax=Naganishia cerealis TaxID=610337 RepID=A0ACC2WJL3_9TREE|nr:hypothetical protein QFC19_001143 [Naganishia cerealis]
MASTTTTPLFEEPSPSATITQAPGSAGLYDYSWWRSMGMARFFGPDLDADDFTGFTPGDWRHSTGGRRRKHRKDYGEIPVLYEAQVFEAEDSHPDNGFESGWECKQVIKPLMAPLAVATPHERLSHLLQARNVDLESHERVNVASTRRIEDINAPVLSYNNNHDVTHSNASRGSDTGEHSLQVRYLIRMPESQIAIASRNQPDEYGEIVSHGPIEIGVWQPLIDLQAESKLDDDNSRGDLNKGNILQ